MIYFWKKKPPNQQTLIKLFRETLALYLGMMKELGQDSTLNLLKPFAKACVSELGVP